MLLKFALIFVGATLAVGQDQAPFSLVRVNAPDAEITDVGWTTPPESNASTKKSANRPYLDPLGIPSPSGTGGLTNPLERTRGGDEWVIAPPATRTAPPSDDSKVTVYTGIKNTGTRSITAVDGEIIFGDRRDQSEHIVVHFSYKKEILPGQSLLLSQKFSFVEGWKRLQQAVQNKSASVKASIAGLDYADGSSWRRPK
jgi:hypothetical protein